MQILYKYKELSLRLEKCLIIQFIKKDRRLYIFRKKIKVIYKKPKYKRDAFN